MNIYAFLAVGVVFAGLVGLAVYLVRKRAAKQPADGELPTPPKPHKSSRKPFLGRIPGWIGLPQEDSALAIYNRSQMASIEGIFNKDGSKLRLRITLANGKTIYGSPVTTPDELYEQIEQIFKA